MPILQRDANNNTVSIKTLNDINAGDPLPVQISQALNATDTAVQSRLGSTNSLPATEPTTDTGLNGVFKGYWQSFKSFLAILGTLSDAAATDGSLMARLRYIATNGTGGSGGAGGTTDVGGVETRLGATSETTATTDTATSGLNGLVKRYLARFTTFLGILGTASDTASATGTLMARLRAIAENAGTGSGSGGSTDVTGVETRLGAVNEAAATTDTTASGLNGLIRRYLARFTTFLGILGTASDTASATGTLMARLGAIASSSGSGGGGASFAEVATATPVSVGTTATDILVINTSGWRFLGLEIHNQNAVDLSNLYLSVRFHSTGDWLRVTYSESDFSANVCKSSGNMGLDVINTSNFGGFGVPISALPAYNKAWIQMQLRGFSGVKITALVATGTTPVSIKAYLH